MGIAEEETTPATAYPHPNPKDTHYQAPSLCDVSWLPISGPEGSQLQCEGQILGQPQHQQQGKGDPQPKISYFREDRQLRLCVPGEVPDLQPSLKQARSTGRTMPRPRVAKGSRGLLSLPSPNPSRLAP